MSEHDRSDDPQALATEAAEWFSCRRSGEMTPAETLALAAWLDRSPAHRAAYEDAARAWQVSGGLRDHPAVLAMREAARGTRVPRRRAWPAMSAAALAAGIAALVTGSLWWANPPVAKLPRSTFENMVGQRSTVLLPDGSKLTLDTDTVLIAEETGLERRMDLVRGRVFFDVAKEPGRPFVVYAGQDSVTATGTAFDVRLASAGLEVNLLRGSVTVDRPASADMPPRSAQLRPGQRLVTQATNRWAIGKASGTSWLRGQLAFTHAPLGDVVAELNRYSKRKIALADPALAFVPIVGVFDTADFDGSVQLIADERMARVVARDRRGVVLAAPLKKKEGLE